MRPAPSSRCGGGYYHDLKSARSTNKEPLEVELRNHIIGFRVCADWLNGSTGDGIHDAFPDYARGSGSADPPVRFRILAGTSEQGMSFQGMSFQGMSFQGMSFQGMTVQGMTRSRG